MITDDVALVCMSRHRSHSLPMQTLRFFPQATVCVAEDERDDYAKLRTSALLLHPNDVTGIGPIRQWILDTVPSRAVVMVPDDLGCVYGLTFNYATRYSAPDQIWGLILNTIECAEDAGAKLAGFNQAWDVRKFSPFFPFALNSWLDGPTMVLSRAIRYDPQLKLHPDIDFALQHLQRFRIVWQDLRFAFEHDRWRMGGGNALHRSEAAHAREMAYLERKWGTHLTVRWQKGTFMSKLNVRRKQPASYRGHT